MAKLSCLGLALALCAVVGCGNRCREAVAPVSGVALECHHNATLMRVGDAWVCKCPRGRGD